MNAQGRLFPVPPTVQVLTLRQPWAWAVIHAGKDVENRSWTPREPFRLLVHAGKGTDRDGFAFLSRLGIDPPAAAREGGRIVGAVDVTGWVRDSPSRWAIPGQWHWQLARPVPVARPLPCTGRLTLFPPPAGWEKAFA